MNITEFLEARITEDESAAKVCLEPANLGPYSDDRIPAIKPEEWGALVDNYLGGPMGKHCARHDPTRVLAECAAKREIIPHLQDFTALEALAYVYKDHPDYDKNWRR